MIQRVESSVYELKIPKMWKSLHLVIDESKLKPYRHPTFAQQQESSLTVIAPSRGGAIQEVERVLNFRRWGNELQYLIKWQGQPFEESTWKDQCEITKEPAQLFWDFHRNHPGASRVPTIQIPGRSYSEAKMRQESRENNIRSLPLPS